MYLKTLALRGFKSFADPTTLDFEPGVTVIVGPNGSGKSNVVDAVAWVLGAQGPRVVRSAKMDDVIFAGTAQRSALGRAEVSLTIDNTSRRLPIDFAEVTITRTLFRTGESEYALNGVPCRLLDLQELLSDSGVGRQQHVIIGQGQLESVLASRPEERRMVIEEAAGVLKYRRRRERAQRRLESSESSLSRLQDLLREVRRQLKPLERQAASAHLHDEWEGELALLRRFLAGRELAELLGRRADADRLGRELDASITSALAELERLGELVSETEAHYGGERPEELDATIGRCERLAERAHGLAALAAERRRAAAQLYALAEDADAVVTLEGDLAQVREDLVRCAEEAEGLGTEWERLGASESQFALAEATHRDRYGNIADLVGALTPPEARAEADGARAELASLREGLARSTERSEGLARRAEEVRGEIELSRTELDRLREEEALGQSNLGSCSERLASAEAALASAEAAGAACDGESHAAKVRVDALELALEEVRARAGLEALRDLPGIIGTLIDLVEVDEAAGAGFEAALDGRVDLVLVEDERAARGALARLQDGGHGGSVLVAGRGLPGEHSLSVSPPRGTEPLRPHVRTLVPGIDPLIDRLVGDVALFGGDLLGAVDTALSAPETTIVTPSGDRFSPTGWRLGAGRSGATRAALEGARRHLEEVSGRLARSNEHLAAARSQREGAAAALGDARHRLELCRGGLTRSEEALTAQVALLAGLEEEAASLATTQRERVASLAQCQERSRLLDEALAGLEANEAGLRRRIEEESAARALLAEQSQAVAVLRRDLELRATAIEERRAVLSSRADELTEALARRREEQRRALARRGLFGQEDLALARLEGLLAGRLESLGAILSELGSARAERERATREHRERLSTIRSQQGEIERRLGADRERRQRVEIDATEVRVRHEAFVEALRRDLDALPEEVLDAPSPELPAGVDPGARCRHLERELRSLGPVNPLAREELDALEERHRFLEAQLEDVRNARRELNRVIGAIDEEIRDVFATAYADVERHFEDLFSTLFPGGEGRLALTAPDDLLSTGVEIEARPAGRNVRRLSLLSGGERSLVALAFLFAVYRSRPSPFYLLDEVEAALDEVNLRRFLDLLEEFRHEAQLVVVSHQKKTMEVADALFGVSMQPGGASKVVSERTAARRSGQRSTYPVRDLDEASEALGSR